MKRIALTIIFIFISFSSIIAKQKLLVLPFNYETSEKYSQSSYQSASDVAFNSLYEIFEYLPTVDVPVKKELESIKYDNFAIKKLAQNKGADLILFGDFKFGGDKLSPKIIVLMKIWSQNEQKVIFSKSYKSSTDLDFFDIIDDMINDAFFAMFGSKATFAELRFTDFKISAKDIYTIMVGSKKLSDVVNKNFYRKLKILANKKYDIYLVRKRDGVLVTNYTVKLKTNEFTNISYTAKADVKVRGVYNGKKGVKYTIIIDGNKYKNGDVLKNTDVSDEHDYIVLENDKVVDKGSFSLTDGEIYEFYDNLYKDKSVYFRVYTLGNSLTGAGADYYFNVNFWMGLSFGFTPFFKTMTVATSFMNEGELIVENNFQLDLGYYFFGGLNTDLRIAALLSGGFYFLWPENLVDRYELLNSGYDIALSLRGEWRFLYGDAGILFDLKTLNIGPHIAIGVKF